MKEKLQSYIQTLDTERIKLFNNSADAALTALVQRHNGKPEEFDKFNLVALVNFYQKQNLEVVIRDLNKILDAELAVRPNVIDVAGKSGI
jgi:hypothetical protein